MSDLTLVWIIGSVWVFFFGGAMVFRRAKENYKEAAIVSATTFVLAWWLLYFLGQILAGATE